MTKATVKLIKQPTYIDFINYIKKESYNFEQKTGIDRDEFTSVAGLVWTELSSKNNTHMFLHCFKKACLVLIRNEFTKKRGYGAHKIELDRPIQADSNDNANHSVIAAVKNATITTTDIALLTSSAKKVLTGLISYKQPIYFQPGEPELKTKTKLRKKAIYKINKSNEKKLGKIKYQKSLQEIAELIPGASVAKNHNTMPIALRKV